jgi:hypothetical protein
VFVLLVTAAVAGPSAGTARDAWGHKPVLDVTLADRWDRLGDCGVDDARVDALQTLAHDVAAEADAWRRSGDAAIRAGGRVDAPLQRAAMAELSGEEADGATRIVGDALPCVLDVLDEAWAEDRARSAPVFTTVSVTYNVYATQYDANTDDEVAVPDYCVKYANLGWSTCSAGYASPPYDVRLDNGGRTYDAWVGDVGPWNIDDNYWDSAGDSARPRRLYTDLAQGYNESRAAYYDDYNGGEDQYGRTVGNPAGIDLAPDTASHIGLAYLQNAWIDVTWSWEGYTVYPDLSLAMSPSARSDQPLDNRGGDGIADFYPGQTWTVSLAVTNSGSEKAQNVTLGAWVEAPYVSVARWESSDGLAVDDPGDSFAVTMGGIDPGETERVTFTLTALAASIGLADHPDLRAWVSHVDGYYEKAGFSDAPSANSYQTWNGGDLVAYVQHDVWPLQTAWTWDDGTAEGWWAADALTATPTDGALVLAGAADDPVLVGPPIDAAAAALPTFSWRGARMGTGPARLYWTTDLAPDFAEDRSVELPLSTGSLAPGVVTPGWTDRVTRLRIDPGPGADAIVTLDEASLGGPLVDTGTGGDTDAADGVPTGPGAWVRLDTIGCGCGTPGGPGAAWGAALAALAAYRRCRRGGSRRAGRHCHEVPGD